MARLRNECVAALIAVTTLLGCSSRTPEEEVERAKQELVGDFLPTGNSVVMEAEHFATSVTQGGHSWVLESDAAASSGQALRASPDNGAAVNTGYTTNSPRLDFRVVFAQTGTYHVWLRGRAAGSDTGSSDSAHAGLDGAAIASSDRLSSFVAGFSWRKSTMDGPVATFSVSSTGLHTVNVWMREDGFVVDKVLLTTDAGFTPSGLGPAETPRETGGATCSDGLKNGSETAVDCGGSACPKCGNGATCLVNADCLSNACVGGTCQATVLPYRDPSLPVATRVADLLSRMTLDEKIGQMTQSEQQTSSPATVQQLRIGSVLSGADSTLNPPSATAWADLIDGYQTAALATPLGIPIIYGIDGVHGHAKVLGGTIFPHNIGLGATRNAALVQQIGVITAQELRATGVPWTFAPALSVARDQRWGRAYESFGEDPALVAQLTTAVTGLQGTSLSLPDSALATAKHYVADGGAIWNTGDNPGGTPIDRGNAQMTDAALRAIHLAPYTSAISRGVGSIMASFSSVNGTKMHASSALITTVLKGELGFTGFVISDWQAIDQLSGTFADKVRVSVNAGVDMFMMPDSYQSFISTLRDEVNAGRVSQARIDDAVRRILTKKFELGLFERPMTNRSGASQIGSTAHRDVARQAVRESLVLLKNVNSFLPLSPTTTVCVTGSGASNLRAQVGAWTLGWQQPLTTLTGTTTILAGITQVVGAARVVTSGCQVGIRVVSETLQSYAEWFGDDSDPDHDGSGTCTASGGCVVVLLGGRPMDIQGLVSDPTTRAIVMAWYPGSEGLGVAQVLYGVGGANFSGKLPVTWKVDAIESPVNFCATTAACGDTGDHYSNPASPPATVLFPYGFGLTYGTTVPSCTDGVRNGTETDIDCGGSCAADCANGRLCSVNADCQSNNCVSGTCQAVGNIAPTIGITAPINNASVVAGSIININANASDSDGTVSTVRFFVGSTEILPADTSSPYSVSWAVPTAPASYSLTASATDNLGATTISVAVGVSATATCSDGVLNGSETGIDCGGSCAACSGTSPCSGLCTNPVVFAGPSFNSGSLGTAATCHQTVANLAGGNCGNFVSPRTLTVNGTAMSCTGNWPSLPAKRNGGYCVQTSAGNQPWAYFATW